MLATVGLYRAIFPALAESRLLRRLAARTPLRPRSLVAALLVLAVLPTNVYLFAWRFVDLGRHGAPFYLHRDEVAALEWLDANTLPDAVVLSSLTVGQYVPPLAGNTAFLAHWAQTVDFYDKRDRVTRFFDNDIEEADRLETVCTFGVDYVFHGPSERTLGAYRPQDATWLAQAFTTPEVAVYRVERQAACQGQP
jgi:uncharacterized membrane protein